MDSRLFLECAGKAARPNRTSVTGGSQRGLPKTWTPGSLRAAATALSPSHNALAGNGYIAKSKAAAGR